ncbi:heme o synthase [Geoalkalibacter halelectricus]|uniref:Protoheme IX farnesyltransferase n=1 Tax=Geoalkalibacter halelectricus TaxID=2847045 RepID=A0ABY5ZTW5_9BACT|nr:heme o synthase [Geoalkalibacter halelectricus]MDO3376744.1 heme o synthase [Geoalkalibacter halelectricus]UWZ81305.1 heme o synthase [Geoalkalibacter halelectricus]
MGSSIVETVAAVGLATRMGERCKAYLLLAKPRILLLVALTGLVAMVLEGSLLGAPWRFSGVLLGILLAGAAANALNQYWDRDIDSVMARTRNKRPIPSGKISPREALGFSLVAALAAIWLLQVAGGSLAALLGLGTLGFYVLIYTLWLKRRTTLNIVVGGAAGAAPPLIGWAAGAGEVGWVPALLFLVIFLWTPVHFWALAICLKEEYAQAGVPMLPVVVGERATCVRIAIYVALLLPMTVWLGFGAGLGAVYFFGATVLGLILVAKVAALWRRKDRQAAWALFGYSNVYLAALFLLMLIPRG